MNRPADARDARTSRALPISLALGLAGLVAWLVGAVFEPRQAYFSYLAAYAYGLSLALGVLVLVMVSHATGAKWFVVLRRLAETAAATLPVFALLFVPLLFGMRELYPWARPLDSLEPELREALGHKLVYLNPPFFIARAGVYFALWVTCALLLRRWSVRQDTHADPELTRRQRVLSAVAMPALGFTLTFAAFDWLMSLSPEWVSTIYGVYYFAGGFLGALALVGVIAFGLQRRGELTGEVAVSHYHALGKLMLTFVIFWAYIAYAQYFIIWIADIPDEVVWYLPRSRGTWGVMGIAIIVGHFVIPLFALLSWTLKRRPAALAAVCVWLLALHYVDLYWLVLPALHRAAVRPHWLDAVALLGVLGCAGAYGCWLGRGHALVPVGDPELESSLDFTTR